NGEPDVFEVAVRGGRRSLEAGEAVKAAHLPQPMYDDEVTDGQQNRIAFRVPLTPRQGLGIEQRARLVVADGGFAAREDVEFRELWRQRRVLVVAAAQLLQPSEDVFVVIPFERCPQR